MYMTELMCASVHNLHGNDRWKRPARSATSLILDRCNCILGSPIDTVIKLLPGALVNFAVGRSKTGFETKTSRKLLWRKICKPVEAHGPGMAGSVVLLHSELVRFKYACAMGMLFLWFVDLPDIRGFLRSQRCDAQVIATKNMRCLLAVESCAIPCCDGSSNSQTSQHLRTGVLQKKKWKW